jgi:hypothetical protein
MPGADAPAASCAEGGRRHTSISHYRFTGTVRHSLHDGLRLTSRSRRSAGLASLRRLLNRSTGLIPASGDHDHTTSPSAPDAHRLRTSGVHRIPPNVS